MDDLTIKIEGGNVIIYRNGGRINDLGTIRPDDDQLCRVIYRAIEFGKALKAGEVRAVLNIH